MKVTSCNVSATLNSRKGLYTFLMRPTDIHKEEVMRGLELHDGPVGLDTDTVSLAISEPLSTNEVEHPVRIRDGRKYQ
jgi:hypothetical protein